MSFKMEKKTVKLEFEKNKNIRLMPTYYTSVNNKMVKKFTGQGQVTYSCNY